MLDKGKYIIDNLMVDNFFEWETNTISLEEKEDTGKSVLGLELKSKENLSIKNVDKKRTDMQFFKNTGTESMFKRVDHIIFECISENKWKLHLIEMKGSVKTTKWKEIKGKFRASYLVAQGIAAMLEMNIVETCMYTTYEQADLRLSETIPTSRRSQLGKPTVKPQEEWEGGNFGLNFGIRLKFMHMPLKMKRDETGVLRGNYAI